MSAHLPTPSLPTTRTWWSGAYSVLLLLCAWMLFVGAGVGFTEHACACPTMTGHAAEHDTETTDGHGHDHGTCACGAESPTDCQCELTPDNPSKTADAHAWTASPQLVGVATQTPHVPHATTVAGFSPQTPPGNWLYGRPPPVSIYLLHRTLLI